MSGNATSPGMGAGSSGPAPTPYNEADILGRVMAHAYADEFEKQASQMDRAQQLLSAGANKAWVTSGNNGRAVGKNNEGFVSQGVQSEALKSLGTGLPEGPFSGE